MKVMPSLDDKVVEALTALCVQLLRQRFMAWARKLQQQHSAVALLSGKLAEQQCTAWDAWRIAVAAQQQLRQSALCIKDKLIATPRCLFPPAMPVNVWDRAVPRVVWS